MEIDFEEITTQGPVVIYIHPNQIHRIIESSEYTKFIGIHSHNIHPEYLEELNKLTPAQPLELDTSSLYRAQESYELSIHILFGETRKYRYNMLKDVINSYLGLLLSGYSDQKKPEVKSLGRHEQIAQEFLSLLEEHFIRLKLPSGYAQLMNLSPSYLNECVKKATGLSVSKHIQQQTILEAKKLALITNKTVYQMALAVGFDNTKHFSRYFKNVVGLSPLNFRKEYYAFSRFNYF